MNLPDDQPTTPNPRPNRQTSVAGRNVWQPPDPGRLQEMLPQYEVIALVGLGGMGAVYKARQKSLNRLVAIKIMQPDLVDEELKFAERFKNEAQTIAQFNHPAIIHVHDFGETGDGLLYFVMEFVDGTDVAGVIEKDGKLPVARAVEITKTVCDALHYAHARGVIHRDIKPANVLINREGEVKVADFGLAKINDPSQATGLTRTNVAMGTQEFAAPEMLTPGAPVDHRADIYSLGVMLYQMLTGEIPRVMFKLPSRCRPELGSRFDAMICKALETEPGERFQTVEEVRQALKAERSGDRSTAGKASKSRADGRRHPSRALFASAMAAAITVIVTGWFFLGHKHGHASVPRQTANVPGGSGSSSLPPAADVIKLWDPPKQAPTEVAVRWDDAQNALVLGDGNNKGMLNWAQPRSRDAIIRADIRVNPDAQYPQLRLRYNWTEGSGDFYRLQLHGGMIDLSVSKHDNGRQIKEWPLPHGYGADDWARLELRAIGDALTVSIDGKELETVHDATLSGPGSVMIVANKNGWFRHVEYVPLDKHDEAKLESGAVRLWSSPEEIPKVPGARWEDGAMRLDNAMMENPAPLCADAEIRALVKMNPDARAAHIDLRGRYPRGANGERQEVAYTLGLEPIRKVIQLLAFTPQWTLMREWPYPRAYGADEWVPLQLRIIGNELTASFDGKLLGTIHDTAITGAGKARVYGKEKAFFRDIVFVPLDTPAAAGGNPWVAVDLRNGGWVADGDGFTTDKPIRGYNVIPGDTADAAVRMTYSLRDASGVQITARDRMTDGKRELYVAEDELGALQIGRMMPNGLVKPLVKETYTAGLTREGEHALEFRIAGDTLTATLNGTFSITARDDALKDGPWAMVLKKGALVKKVEMQLPPAAKPGPGTTIGKVIDLLPLADVNRDAINSTWSIAPEGGIRSLRSMTAGRFEFNYAPPAEYDFDIEFTVENGDSGYVMQVLPVPGHWLDWRLLPPPAFGPALDGVEPGNGPRTEGIGKLYRLKPGDRHRSVVEVRKNSLRALVDGTEIARYTGDFKRLSDTVGVFKLRDTSHVGIGVLDIGLLVHKAVVREMSGTQAEDGFRPLFDGKSLDGWLSLNGNSPPNGWRVEAGAMTGKGYSAVLTREEFGDFDLRLEWRVNPQGNGGIYYRVTEDDMIDHPLHAVEFNLMDEDIQAPPLKQCGAAFDLKSPLKKAAHPAGEWNTARLLVQGTCVEHWINDRLVCSYDLTDAPVREGLERAGIGAGFAAVKNGRIALQDWQGEAFYRNVRIRELRDDDPH